MIPKSCHKGERMWPEGICLLPGIEHYTVSRTPLLGIADRRMDDGSPRPKAQTRDAELWQSLPGALVLSPPLVDFKQSIGRD